MAEIFGVGEGAACSFNLSVVILGLDPRIPGGTTFSMAGWVYIMANRPRGAIYVGVTSDLVQRVWQHKQGVAEGFTKTNNTKMLVYFEDHATMPLAIQREHTMKHWVRAWKDQLVEAENPKWDDLWSQITG